jgi:cobalt-zinc-cadmium efflux system protein
MPADHHLHPEHDHPHGHPHDHAHDHDHQHGHDHGHGHGAAFGVAFAVGTALNVALVAGQVGVGLIAHSVALLADAAHNFGDVLALLLAWGAAALGLRMPSRRRTYGWGRTSILAALINAIVLLVSIGAIAVEALHRFAAPAPVAGGLVMAVAAAGIVVNGVTAWLFSRGQGDLNIRAAFLHMAADAAVSAGVLVAALAIVLTGATWIDPAASLLVAAVIGVSTWGLLRDATNLALDGVPWRISPGDVEAYLAGLPGVLEVHDLHIWGLSTTDVALTAHLVCTDPATGQALLPDAAASLAGRFGISHATLQVESAEFAAACRLRPAHVV